MRVAVFVLAAPFAERQVVLEGDAYDDLADEQPMLSGITAASVFNIVSTGERSGLGLEERYEIVVHGYAQNA